MNGYTLVFINQSPATHIFCKTMAEVNQQVAQITDLDQVLVFAGPQLRITRNVSHSIASQEEYSVVPRKRGRPPGSKNKPKAVASPVVATEVAGEPIPVPVDVEATEPVATKETPSVVDQVIEAMTTPHNEAAPALSAPIPQLFEPVRRRRGRPAKEPASNA